MRNLPGFTLVFCGLAACAQTDAQRAQAAVEARLDGQSITLRNVRMAAPYAFHGGRGTQARLGGGLCGEVVGAKGDVRYFVWQKAEGRVLFATESGLLAVGPEVVNWAQYCRADPASAPSQR